MYKAIPNTAALYEGLEYLRILSPQESGTSHPTSRYQRWLLSSTWSGHRWKECPCRNGPEIINFLLNIIEWFWCFKLLLEWNLFQCSSQWRETPVHDTKEPLGQMFSSFMGRNTYFGGWHLTYCTNAIWGLRTLSPVTKFLGTQSPNEQLSSTQHATAYLTLTSAEFEHTLNTSLSPLAPSCLGPFHQALWILSFKGK